MSKARKTRIAFLYFSPLIAGQWVFTLSLRNRTTAGRSPDNRAGGPEEGTLPQRDRMRPDVCVCNPNINETLMSDDRIHPEAARNHCMLGHCVRPTTLSLSLSHTQRHTHSHTHTLSHTHTHTHTPYQKGWSQARCGLSVNCMSSAKIHQLNGTDSKSAAEQMLLIPGILFYNCFTQYSQEQNSVIISSSLIVLYYIIL